MPTVEESIYIPKPPQEVFNYVSSPEAPTQWDSSLIEYHQDDGPVHVGTISTGKSKVLGRKFEWKSEVIEFEAPRRIATRSIEGAMDFKLTLTFQAEGEGTRFTTRIDAGSGLGGIFGKITDPLVQKAHARATRANLETLVEILTEHAK